MDDRQSPARQRKPRLPATPSASATTQRDALAALADCHAALAELGALTGFDVDRAGPRP